MESIIDVSADFSSIAKPLYDAGVRTVIRYYNNAAGRASKRLSAAEAKRWHEAGIATCVVYEDRGGDSGHVEDFGEANGKAAAFRALELAGVVGQPKGSAIYPAVDGDYSKPEHLAAIRAYFEAFAGSVRAAGYRVGGYGCGTVVEMLRHEKLIDLVWLAGAMGWSGSRALRDSGDYDLMQAPTKNATVGGVAVSYDPNTAKSADFGQWGVAGGGAQTGDKPLSSKDNGPAARILRKGDRGPDVRQVRESLGLDSSDLFGPETEQNVRSFQLGAGLTVDGIVGPATHAALASKGK